MKNCPTSLREQALNVVKGNTEVTPEQKILKKLFYYMECYCVELKMTELDVLLNDENYDSFYSLFDSVMMKNHVLEA
jgi:hypothetical protein